MYEDLKTRNKVNKLSKGYDDVEFSYAITMSPIQVTLPSRKEASTAQTARRVQKKKYMHSCIKSVATSHLI